MGRWYSVTAVKTFEDCPEKFNWQYVKRKKVEQQVPVHWRFGTCGHAALEAAWKQRMAEQPDHRPMIEYLDLALAALEESWIKEKMPHGSEKDRAIDILQRTLEHQGVDSFTVLGVEQKFTPVTPDGTEMIGYADLVLEVAPGVALNRDYKFRSTPADPESLGYDFQLNTYGWMVLRQWPHIERVLMSHYYPPITKEVTVPSDPEAQKDAVARIEAVAEMVTVSDFKPKVGPQCESCVYKTNGCSAWADSPQTEAMVGIKGF